MNYRYALLLFFLLLSWSAYSQQTTLHNQYFVNKYALSPAYAGHNTNFEGFASYRNNWLGVAGAPEARMLHVNGPVAENMGIGGIVTSDQVGIFRNFSIAATYNYHLKLNQIHNLNFGLSAGMLESHVAIGGNDLNDPVAASNANARGLAFDATLGILYRFRNFNAGIVIPQLTEGKIKNNAGTLYSLKRHYIAHFSYKYHFHRDWLIEPLAILRTTASSPLNYEISALVKYRKQIWLATGYGNGNNLLFSLGGLPHNRIAVNYSYEYGTSGMLASSSGTHELSIGFLIGNKGNNTSSVFDADITSNKNKPYMDWMEE